MKYVMSWKPHTGGSAADNEASIKRSLEVFSKWAPPDTVTFHEFVTRADGRGGYAVVTTDDLAAMMGEVSKFTPFNEFEVVPVLDIAEGIGLVSEAISYRDGIG